jgi:WD40 repeat protein
MFLPEQDSLKLISTSEDNTMRVWDLVLKTEIANLKGHSSIINCLTFTNDKSTLISAGRDGKIILWNSKDNFRMIAKIE